MTGPETALNRGFCALALWNPKNPLNVGGVMRAADCYGADLLVIGGKRAANTSRHIPTDMSKAWQRVPTIIQLDPFDAMPLGSIPVAVDLIEGAEPLPAFKHHERAFYVFGPEDGTLRTTIYRQCKHVVMVPTR